METIRKKEEGLHMRIDAKDLDTFKVICSTRYKIKYTDMLRDIIKAFNDDRLTITPTPAQQKLFNKEG